MLHVTLTHSKGASVVMLGFYLLHWEYTVDRGFALHWCYQLTNGHKYVTQIWKHSLKTASRQQDQEEAEHFPGLRHVAEIWIGSCRDYRRKAWADKGQSDLLDGITAMWQWFRCHTRVPYAEERSELCLCWVVQIQKNRPDVLVFGLKDSQQ